MKKRQLKIKLGLLISLVVILGLTVGLYFGFCKGKGYNKIAIEVPTTEQTEEITTEETTEEIPQEEETTDETTTEETTTEPVVKTNWEKYNPVEQLSTENWALTLINKKYTLDKSYSPEVASLCDSSITADIRVAEAFNSMYESAKSQDILLTPFGGYANFNKQKTIFDSKVKAFTIQGMTNDEAVDAASKRLEPAGASENGAGLAVDIVSASAGFASTKEYKWLTENAHKYGFILRYPADKSDITGIVSQPWHWRYVGVDAATEIKNNNMCLEEYLKAE